MGIFRKEEAPLKKRFKTKFIFKKNWFSVKPLWK